MELSIARYFAQVLVTSHWERAALLEQSRLIFGRKYAWQRALIDKILERFGPSPPPPRLEVLTAFIRSDEALALALRKNKPLKIARWVLPVPRMTPALGAPSTWALPELCTPLALAEHLGLELNTLDWFARTRGAPQGQKLEHYRYRWIKKRSGGGRLLEAPKERLKKVQRSILQDILTPIPVHDAAQAYVPGRSVVSHASLHTEKQVVLRLDLRDFFTSIQASRVNVIFRTAGYPEAVARLLTGLCTNQVPRAAWDAPWQQKKRYALPHLPQGAPTSPALANLCALGLDRRLTALTTRFGARYSRYADDLIFSGDRAFAKLAENFEVWTAAIALEEGFELNHRKTKRMLASQRQRVTGVVVNAHPNLSRDRFDRLKATLHNCVRHGPASQNRDQHADFRAYLAGSVGHAMALNPKRGLKLKALFQRIDWPEHDR